MSQWQNLLVHGLSDCCEAALKKLNIKNQKGGTYMVMEGPQFSTLAESNLIQIMECAMLLE